MKRSCGESGGSGRRERNFTSTPWVCLDIPKAPATSLADTPTALDDYRKLCRCRVRLRSLYLALGLKPIFQIVTVCLSAPFVKFVGTLLDLLLNRDQDCRLVRLRC